MGIGKSKIPLDESFIREWSERAVDYQFRGLPLRRMNRDELLAVCAWHIGQLTEAQRLLGDAIHADSPAPV